MKFSVLLPKEFFVALRAEGFYYVKLNWDSWFVN